ncbi:hypothetical protein [Aquidulcibacter sp.]|uniref:hypothetical protein n=1 Tax=Aquidulcibacter sp. TaxID=2052990 RepID=UPI0025C255F9|nr:hypothetical protein [Aquidulcibacter sp.]MCA3692792.1 hypothetical protein [Aquidulcibacter sp.]
MKHALRLLLSFFALICLANCSENEIRTPREIPKGTVIEGYVYNGGAVSNLKSWEGTEELWAELKKDGNKVGVTWVSPITGEKSVSVGSGWRRLENEGSLASASQRGSILLVLDSTVKAARDMAELEVIEGNPLTRNAFADRAKYVELIQDYQSGISAIHASGNVNQKASNSIIESTIPSFLDSSAKIQKKADKRHRLLNAAAVAVGRQPPFVRPSFIEKIEEEAKSQSRKSL